ncbi:uncharacterized protein LOC128745816 [Sabethes cyaneus]|uniref:uncharacterized protein LOC128745816 n=1 Tax=Sabethes cyaneus TaxID=53552 RepID=UPI00237E61F1|nr:uncharacterized protein LOC128745816 [Sabethes cyaneus]
MDKCCYECTLPIKNLNLIKCYLCDSVAHMKCFGWVPANLDFINSQSNLLWFCADCLKSVELLKHQTSPDLSNAVVSSVSNVISSCMNDIKDELAQTNAFIKSVSDKLTSAATPVISTSNRTNKRPRISSPDATPKQSIINKKLFGGTRSADNASVAVEKAPKPAEKFWIYLSRIAPFVTETEIATLVDTCMPGAQPIVKKLIKKYADLKSYGFVSFKVGVDLNLKELSLNPSTWPTGVYFRAFEERSSGSRDFWLPSATELARIDRSTPAQSSVAPRQPV